MKFLGLGNIAKVMFLLFFGLVSPVFAEDPVLVSPQKAGMSSTKLEAVTDTVKKLIRKKHFVGTVVMISRNGETVYLDAQGMRDQKEKAKMKTDTIFRIYSMTKPVTSVAILMLVERGKINLDAPVEQYLPEFKKVKVYTDKGLVKQKRKMTVRDLLRHTAGLTYGFFSKTPVDDMYNKNHPLYSKTTAEFVQKASSMPLLYQPGTIWHYSIATDVLGALVERVTGQTLGVFMQENIFTPLQMNDTGFYVPKDKHNRFASSYRYGGSLVESYKTSHFLDPNRMPSGGGGLVSTASDYMKFCQMLLNKGKYQSVRLLQEETVAQMRTDQLPDGVKAYGYFGFGLGVMVQLYDWGNKGRPEAYSWSGAASTNFWISPKDHLIVIALAQRQPFSNELKKAIQPLIYQAIKK